MLAALVGMTAAADAETRSLKLYFLHTGEKAIIAYKKNGTYIPSGLKKVNQFLRDWRRNEPTKMDPQLLDLIWEVYQQSGSRDYIHVVSAYRSPATNSMLRKRGRGVAKYSQHMLGKAMDFFLPDVKLSKLREIGLKAGVGGVGYYPTSGSPFVHLDTGNVRHWPRMTRTQLVKVFPRGGTLHVPTDGKPLPGYNAALASYKARKSSGKTALASASPKKDDKKSNSLLGRLFASAQQEQEEDEEANSIPAPRTVSTTATGSDSQPRQAELTAGPAPEGQPSRELLESGTPMQIVTDDPQPIELARIPVPTPRPNYAPAALLAENTRPMPVAPAENPVIAALTADDIETMRRSAVPSPRPASAPAATTASAEGETVAPEVARDAILEALDARRPARPGAAPANIPTPSTSPLTVASIAPTPDPRRAAAPRTLELALAATENRSNSAGEAIRSLIEADSRLRARDGIGDFRPTRTAGLDDARPAPRRTAAAPAGSGQAVVTAPPRTAANRDTPRPTDWESIGVTALASFQPIEDVNRIRAPAYGMGMMRETPREILSTGFIRTAFVQPARRFTAGNGPAFNRFTD